jgi:hypothetical protein
MLFFSYGIGTLLLFFQGAKNMERKRAMEHLIAALVETGAEFSARDGIFTVGGLTFNCGEQCIVATTGQASNYYRYETLCYISGKGDQLCIADSHAGVFGTYKVR